MSDFTEFSSFGYPDFKGVSDREIFDRLKEAGIGITLEEFASEARETGNPSDLTDKWFEKYNLSDDFDFPLYDTIMEVWKRHIKDIVCPELLADEIDDIIDSIEDKDDLLDRDILLHLYNQLKDFYHKFIKEDGTPDDDLFSELYEYSYNDIECFLQQIPFDLENSGLTDEAVNIGRWFSRLSAMPQYHLKGTACILANAGRREEALRQIDENIENFPDDFETTISSGDAMMLLGEEEKAETFFMEGSQLADSNREKMTSCQRLIDFYSERGDAEKAAKWQKRRASFMDVKKNRLGRKIETVVKGPKTGRNEPCPCGSGKKYKKCCIGKMEGVEFEGSEAQIEDVADNRRCI